jgi:hypothetical protein
MVAPPAAWKLQSAQALAMLLLQGCQTARSAKSAEVSLLGCCAAAEIRVGYYFDLTNSMKALALTVTTTVTRDWTRLGMFPI